MKQQNFLRMGICIMKKTALLMVLCALFLMPNLAFAEKVYTPLYGGGVDNFASFIKNLCAQCNIKTWGEEIKPRAKGGKIYTITVGKSWMKVSYIINQKGTDWVQLDFSWEEIEAANEDSDNGMPASSEYGLLLQAIMARADIEQKEAMKFGEKMIADLKRMARKNPNAESFEKTYVLSTASSKKRKIEVDVHFGDNYYLNNCWFRFDAFTDI